MGLRTRRGVAVSLVMASHPVPAALLTVAMAAAALLGGRGLAGAGLVAAAVLTGQVVVGWLDDLVDRHRDREVGRRDKPVAMGWVDPGTVVFALACAVLLLVPLSVASGPAAGVAHLLAVAALALARLWPGRTALSWLPYAVGYGLLPAFLSYGAGVADAGATGGPPTWTMTALAALVGVGVHFADALPDLVEDRATGVRHLPLRIALRVGAPRLLWLTTAYVVVVGAGIAATALTTGLRQ